MNDRILVLDDERSILDVLGQHLEAEGYDCTITDSPRHALELLREEDFSLLITDLKMSELSGMEVVKRIKEMGKDISIIVVTAMIEVTNAIQAMRTGADDYVLKPFNLSEISLSVARAIEKRTLIIENRAYQQQLESRVADATQELAAANAEVRETKEYLESLIESTLDAIITIGEGGRVAFANSGARRMMGYPEDEILTKGMDELYVGGAEESQYVVRVLRADKPLQNYETELKHKSGTTIPVSMSISQIPATEGRPASTLAICKDITEQKRLELELKEMTIRDNLTGLYNQRYFYDRLDAEIERARRQKRPLSLLLVDIDHFKSYNDSRGHLEGDRVLQEVGSVIRVCTREHVDYGFRYGGDEFTVILPEAPAATAHDIAERIRGMFEEKRFDLLTMSVGLTTYQEGYSVRKFIQYTDSLMYDAKRAGGNRVYVFGADETADEESTTA